MSEMPHNDPALGDALACDAIDMIVVPRARDIGGFEVRRALPAPRRQMVGPFIFLDQMGPADFVIGEGIDVRPHPHIGLSTLTYLHDGEIMHRDSLGTEIAIRPGAVNWMTAGRGIAHSERSGRDFRARGGRLGGLQMWVALRAHEEEREPAFIHHAESDLPVVGDRGVTARIVAGSLFGATSPLAQVTDAVFADVQLAAGAQVPLDADMEERAIYLSAGEIEIAGDVFAAGRLLIFKPGDRITIRAREASRLAILGGPPMDGPRHIWWNFVSSRKDRIDAAKADWKAGRFAHVPGETEFIPLPE
jgi:redox-sensitive bicupin YhaK (pirin superfamily)